MVCLFVGPTTCQVAFTRGHHDGKVYPKGWCVSHTFIVLHIYASFNIHSRLHQIKSHESAWNLKKLLTDQTRFASHWYHFPLHHFSKTERAFLVSNYCVLQLVIWHRVVGDVLTGWPPILWCGDSRSLAAAPIRLPHGTTSQCYTADVSCIKPCFKLCVWKIGNRK